MKKIIIPLSLAITGFAGAVAYFAIKNRCLQVVMETQAKMIKTDKEFIDKNQSFIEKQKELLTAKDRVIENQKELLIVQDRVIENQKSIIEKTANRTTEPVHHKPEKKDPDEKVFQYDADFKVVQSYPSVPSAAIAVNADPETIRGAIKGKQISAKGYFWSKGTRPLKKFPEKWEKRAAEIKQQ